MAHHRSQALVYITTLVGIVLAQPPGLSLERLAASWGEGKATPLCRRADPNTYWGALPGTQQCTWPEVNRTGYSGRFT